MLTLHHTTFLALLLSLPATAQSTLHESTFDTDTSGWTTTGSWHHVTDTDICSQALPAYPTPGGAVSFADPDCTFNQTWLGSLTMTQPVSIPANAVNPQITFQYLSTSEPCNGWDMSIVNISEDLGQTWSELGSACQRGNEWFTFSEDLTPFAGQDILISLDFDAIDGVTNEGHAWLIDDVRITQDGCTTTQYCIASPNSASPAGATIGSLGSTQINNQDFVLTMDSGPPNQFSLFFYGQAQIQSPLANGTLCITSTGGTGFGRLYPGDFINASGQVQHAIDFQSTLTTPTPILSGSTWNFQCWYRDSAIGGTNFSNALSVNFCD